ncbi:MAG: hypothetical protein COA44_13175 [Arcobacter sp.]|nr:MAG: hypothetical protein COA44_13175 [Arcobacter sp.]
MQTYNRYTKSLSKTIGLSPDLTNDLLNKLIEHIKNDNFSNESFAKNLNKNLKYSLQVQHEKNMQQAAIKKEDLYVQEYKDLIIKLYQGSEKTSGLGYKRIHEYLVFQCETEEAKKKVISASTIRKYLHENWGIKKNINRRIPTEAIEARINGNYKDSY